MLKRLGEAWRESRERRRQEEDAAWWIGRRVIIRPDVPGAGTRSGDTIFVTTPEERARLGQALHELYEEKMAAIRERQEQDRETEADTL